MKHIVILLVAIFCFKQTKAQDDQIIYGNVRYDGFQKITKGAFWAKRPEAKMVYQGGFPPGVEVYELTEDYFVRFIDSEHNNFDRNYIVFPKGQKVYTKNGNYYAAICGNGIEYLQPVNKVEIIEVKVPAPPPPPPKKDTVWMQAPAPESRLPEIGRAQSPAPVFNDWKPAPQYTEPVVKNRTNVFTIVVSGLGGGQQYRQPKPRRQQQRGYMGGGRQTYTANRGYMGGGRGDGAVWNNGNGGGGRGD